MSSYSNPGPAVNNDGSIPFDLNDVDPLEISIRARTAAIALSEIVPFLDQVHATDHDELDAIYSRDFDLDAGTLHHLAESLGELADQAEKLFDFSVGRVARPAAAS